MAKVKCILVSNDTTQHFWDNFQCWYVFALQLVIYKAILRAVVHTAFSHALSTYTVASSPNLYVPTKKTHKTTLHRKCDLHDLHSAKFTTREKTKLKCELIEWFVKRWGQTLGSSMEMSVKCHRRAIYWSARQTGGATSLDWFLNWFTPHLRECI